jgi:hypothetical protein
MSERESQIDREADLDVESDIGATSDAGLDTGLDTGIGDTERGPADQTTNQSTDSGLTGRVRSRAGSIVSSGGLVAGILVSFLGIFLVNAIPLIGSVSLSGLLGVVLATFVHGVFRGESRYIEAALAGAIAAGGSVLLSVLFLALFGVGTGMVVIATVGGAVAGALGHYFGRDFRKGLTRDID